MGVYDDLIEAEKELTSLTLEFSEKIKQHEDKIRFYVSETIYPVISSYAETSSCTLFGDLLNKDKNFCISFNGIFKLKDRDDIKRFFDYVRHMEEEYLKYINKEC